MFQGVDEILETMITISCGLLLPTGGAIMDKLPLGQLFCLQTTKMRK